MFIIYAKINQSKKKIPLHISHFLNVKNVKNIFNVLHKVFIRILENKIPKSIENISIMLLFFNYFIT